MRKSTITVPDLSYLQLDRARTVFYQLNAAELVDAALKRNEGVLADTGALAIDTGEFTGRSPKDRFIVEDDITRDNVWWGKVNIKFGADKLLYFRKLQLTWLTAKYLCATPAHVPTKSIVLTSVLLPKQLSKTCLFITCFYALKLLTHI
jgi:ATP-dependent phosphoenolpyruvate carboxykinase